MDARQEDKASFCSSAVYFISQIPLFNLQLTLYLFYFISFDNNSFLTNLWINHYFHPDAAFELCFSKDNTISISFLAFIMNIKVCYPFLRKSWDNIDSKNNLLD